MKKLSTLIFAAIFAVITVAAAQTSTAAKPRTAAQLKKILMSDYSLPTNAKVISIGMVNNDEENNFQLVQVTRFWSLPYSPVQHSRYDLVVFEGDKVVGCYSNFIENKPLINGCKASFNGIDSSLGNEIDFADGVPLMVTIAGETYSFKDVDFVSPAYEAEE